MYADIARFGYDNGGYGVGAPSPMTTGSIGASDPTSAYLSNFNPTNDGFAQSLGMTPPGGGGGINAGGLGFNLDTAGLALGGLKTIGSLWQAWEANKLAKKQFAFTKDAWNTNVANQIQTYNTTLEDRTRARTNTEGGTAEDAQAYIDRHSLRRQ